VCVNVQEAATAVREVFNTAWVRFLPGTEHTKLRLQPTGRPRPI